MINTIIRSRFEMFAMVLLFLVEKMDLAKVVFILGLTLSIRHECENGGVFF
jgi:hypothetical protein